MAIGLGLIHRPKLILADEPTSNLDDENCAAVISLLKEEAELCGSSLTIITHDQRVKNSLKIILCCEIRIPRLSKHGFKANEPGF